MSDQIRGIVAIGLHLASYTMPFIADEVGYVFFRNSLAAFFRDGVNTANWYWFFAFFSPLISSPILMLLCVNRYSGIPIVKVLANFMLFWMWAGIILSFGLAVQYFMAGERNIIGYVLWLLSFVMFMGIYERQMFYKKKITGTIDHLIDNK